MRVRPRQPDGDQWVLHPSSGVDWSTAPTAVAIGPIDVPGSNTLAKVGEYQVTRPGCYSYAGLLTGKVGGETVWTVDHPVGQASQTTLV